MPKAPKRNLSSTDVFSETSTSDANGFLQSGRAYPTVPLFLSFFSHSNKPRKRLLYAAGEFLSVIHTTADKNPWHTILPRLHRRFVGMRPVKSGTPHILPYHKNHRKHISGNNLRNGNKYLETDTNGNLHP